MKAASVSDLMTTDVVSLAAEEDLVLAQAVMKLRRIRHIPVLRGEKLVGMITHRDLLKAQAKFLVQANQESTDEGKRFMSVTVADIMTKDVATVTPDTPAKEAAKTLLERKIGGLPVVAEGTLVGIVTEADFLRWALED